MYILVLYISIIETKGMEKGYYIGRNINIRITVKYCADLLFTSHF